MRRLAKGGIEALDEGGIDPACALRFLNEGLDHRFVALHNAAMDVQLSLHTLLDDLHNQWQCWARKSVVDVLSPHSSGAMHSEKPCDRLLHNWPDHLRPAAAAKRHLADLVGQYLDQIQIAVRTDCSTEPQSR